jgi:hypothetical protein
MERRERAWRESECGLAVCYGVPTRQAGDGLQVFQDLYGAESIVESTVLKVT